MPTIQSNPPNFQEDDQEAKLKSGFNPFELSGS